MEVQRNGMFSFVINSEQLSQGLRHSSYNARNKGSMESLSGMIGIDKVLQSLDLRTRIATVITDAFPYPQLFVLSNHILVCGETQIFEYNYAGDSLDLKLTVAAGSTWRVLDYFECIYMSNETVSVVRDPQTQQYAESDLPVFGSGCDYNGQAVLGTGVFNE